jgi:hypothetical protein
MKKITDSIITKINSKFAATCKCGHTTEFINKDSALKMLDRGVCRSCKKDYRNVSVEEKYNIYKNADNKWCSKCSGCGVEQPYTRRNHAIESEKEDRQCRKCTQSAKKFSNNQHVGPKQRLYNKFSKSAKARRLEWDLDLDTMFNNYGGKCALTGWEINTEYGNCTASLDRIDSNKGYTKDNVQWVHSMVNMSKNKLAQDKFMKVCKAVANKTKW